MITRRQFASGLAAAGTTSLLGAPLGAAEPPPETTRLRFIVIPDSICFAPQYVAEELLRAEGFTDVQYVKAGRELPKLLSSGEVDLTMSHVVGLIDLIGAGEAVTILAGVHPGCIEVVATNQIRTIRDIKGKTAAVPWSGSGRQLFLASVLAYVGLNPSKDVNWVFHSPAEAIRLLAARKIDVFLASPPDAQELRARKIGRVLLSTTTDRPWSQYFCCLLGGNREFARKHPVAVKRALRAILKANAICVAEPDRVARGLVDKGYAKQYEYAKEAIREIPYGRWREYDVVDTVRFYALRLHEAGFIKGTPQRILAEGVDLRFFDQLKQELKG